MIDQFPPPGWLPRPDTWSYWLPTAQPNPFNAPPAPNDASDQVRAQWWRQAVGGNGDAAIVQPDDLRDRTNPAWLYSAMPPISNGGILGSFPESNNAPTTFNGGGGILGSFGQSNDQPDQSASVWPNSGTSSPPSGGILAPLERLTSQSGQSTPAWLQSVMPFGVDSISSAQPGSSSWGRPQTPAVWPPNAPLPGGFDWLSLARKAVEPIASYPQTYSQMNRDAREQIAQGTEQVRQAYEPGVHDPIRFLKGLGNVGLGTLGYVGSPINAALRTIAGKPIEETIGIPRAYTEFALALGIPGLGLRSAAPARPPTPALKNLPDFISDATAVRPLSALEEIQRIRYNHAYNVLREIDPANPRLSALDRSRYFPQSWDVYELRQEIARLKGRMDKYPNSFDREARRKLSALDDHHLLPNESDFAPFGIDPGDYKMFLDAGWHRLLHKYHWNLQWQQYLKYLNSRSSPPTQEEIFEQLRTMMKQSPYLRP